MRSDALPLGDRVAFVTGSGHGLGSVVARRLAELGARVVINSFHSRERGEETAAALVAAGYQAVHLWGSVAHPKQLDDIFAEIERRFGVLDIFINNASNGFLGPLELTTPDLWQRSYRTNVISLHQGAMRAAKLMTRGGRVVTITSPGAQGCFEYFGCQGTMKAAVESLARYLAIELAPRNILVNAISAGPILGERLQTFPEADRLIPDWQSHSVEGRVCTEDEVASLIVRLARRPRRRGALRQQTENRRRHFNCNPGNAIRMSATRAGLAVRSARFRALERDRYDAIVIGAGIGGLTAAALLARRGRSVLVIDQHYVVGGNASSFRRRKYEFDIGLHYVGDCGDTGFIPRILRAAGVDDVVFRELDPEGYDTLVFPDMTFRIPCCLDEFRRRLVALFPDQAQGIDRYLRFMRQTWSLAPVVVDPWHVGTVLSRVPRAARRALRVVLAGGGVRRRRHHGAAPARDPVGAKLRLRPAAQSRLRPVSRGAHRALPLRCVLSAGRWPSAG